MPGCLPRELHRARAVRPAGARAEQHLFRKNVCFFFFCLFLFFFPLVFVFKRLKSKGKWRGRTEPRGSSPKDEVVFPKSLVPASPAASPVFQKLLCPLVEFLAASLPVPVGVAVAAKVPGHRQGLGGHRACLRLGRAPGRGPLFLAAAEGGVPSPQRPAWPGSAPQTVCVLFEK